MKALSTFMARILLCLILSLTVHWTAQSQQTTPLYQQVDSILADLDFTEVTTQVLYNKGFDMWNWAYYDGSMPTDSAAHSAGQWGWMRIQAVTSFLGSYDPLPDPSVYSDLMIGLTDEDPIPIATLWLDYHRIREDAIDEGLMYIDPVDSSFQDVFPRQESPYIRDTTFMGTTLLQNIRVGTRQLVFLDTLQMANIGLSYTISLNLNDGAGWRSITSGTPISVTFDSLGTKYFTIRFTDSSSREWFAKTRVEIIEDPYAEETESFRTGGYSDMPDMTVTTIPGVQLDIFFGNACGKISKPFIFIEGFNASSLQNQRWDEMRRRLNDPEFDDNEVITPTGNTTWRDLHDSGFDVIYVDFADGAADIFDNGDVVRDVIEFVNAQKALNGSAEKNIVLGASMGGLCGYWALGKMEEDEVDHQVSKFITFDTPFRGANIPIGLQLLIKHFYNYEIAFGRMLRDEEPFIELAKSVFDLPAAKQMLYFNAWNPAKSGFSTWRNDFYAQLHTVSVTKAEHIAISNGSGIGEGQLMSCGGLYLDVPYQTGGDFWGTFKINKAKTYLAMNYDDEQVLYEYAFYKRVLLIIGFKWEWGEFDGYSIPSIDCAPGGVTDFFIGTIFAGSLGNGASITQMFPQPNRAAFCFVPTISSQNIADQSNFFLSFNQGSCTNQSISDCVQSRDNNYISPFTSTAAHNQNHVVLTSNLATYLLNDFFNPGFTSPVNNFTYNFGKREPDQPVNPAVLSFTSTPTVININTEISNTGQLWINRIDKLAKTNVSSNPENDEDQLFDVYITKDCNGDPVNVEVHSGGKLHVGESDNPSINKGILHIMEDAVLILDDGGEALTEDQSQIQIEENGILEIKEGGLVNTIFGSGISVKAGGKLIVRDGGILRLSHYSSLTIEPGGLLLFEDGAILQLWDAPAVDGEARIIVKGALEIQGEIVYDGNGFFDFYPGHELKLTNGTLTLEGNGKANRFIRLSEGANLNLGDAVVEISDCRIVYEGESTISAEEAGLMFTNVDFQGYQNRTTGIEPFNVFRLQFEGCTFRDHDFGLNIDGFTGAAITLGVSFDDCIFTDNFTGIAAFNVPLIDISYTDFDEGVGEENTGLYLYDCGVAKMRGTDFDGFDYGIKTFRTPEISLFSSSIKHCEYGIFDGDATGVQPSAVYLIHDSEISSCGQGIYMIGNEFEGLVFMDCARLWENDIGINGDDITLAIDARSHALATDGTIESVQ